MRGADRAGPGSARRSGSRPGRSRSWMATTRARGPAPEPKRWSAPWRRTRASASDGATRRRSCRARARAATRRRERNARRYARRMPPVRDATERLLTGPVASLALIEFPADDPGAGTAALLGGPARQQGIAPRGPGRGRGVAEPGRRRRGRDPRARAGPGRPRVPPLPRGRRPARRARAGRRAGGRGHPPRRALGDLPRQRGEPLRARGGVSRLRSAAPSGRRCRGRS